jgi:hypothetical protein
VLTPQMRANGVPAVAPARLQARSRGVGGASGLPERLAGGSFCRADLLPRGAERRIG